ncbi:MAG: radical SAM protein [Pseudomonadota bacterium]|nr:radical SAM protein [Pseudomonadota bacterium]
MISYKHALSITNQMYFCAAPVRLDSYDTCQLGCTYCFSRDRSRYQANPGIHAASAKALEQRLARVEGGVVASALDELLLRRVPIQLGGLQDPFTDIERERRVTLSLLKVLQKNGYPTIISTKGSLFLNDAYMDILKEMNVVFRISAAGIADEHRKLFEKKSGSFTETIKKIETLKAAGIPTLLRIQPVIPGFEEAALQMTTQAAAAGVSQVTFEYLKIVGEQFKEELGELKSQLGFDLFAVMQDMGLKRIGPDWALTVPAKLAFVRRARAHCKALGIKFGAGDTEFIPMSDGDGCCGSSSFFLHAASQFGSNYVGVIKSAIRRDQDKLSFSDFAKTWTPQFSVGNYFDWRSRVGADERQGRTDWQALMARRWNGKAGPYSPGLFYGVERLDAKDKDGFHLYSLEHLRQEISSPL